MAQRRYLSQHQVILLPDYLRGPSLRLCIPDRPHNYPPTCKPKYAPLEETHSVIPFLTPGNIPADSGHVFEGIGKRQGVNPNEKSKAPQKSWPQTRIVNAVPYNHLLRVPQGRNLINPLTSTGQDGPAYHMPNYAGTWLFPPTKLGYPGRHVILECTT
jgi:hypothetical protein